MTKEYTVEVEIKETKSVQFRKNDARNERPWDWHADDGDIESSEYFKSFEDAYADAQKAVG